MQRTARLGSRRSSFLGSSVIGVVAGNVGNRSNRGFGVDSGHAGGQGDVAHAQRGLAGHAGEIHVDEFGQILGQARNFHSTHEVADEALVDLDGRAVFTTEEVQRHAHRHVGVRVDTLEVHVQNLVLVRVHLEGTQDHELFSAVEFHRQNGGVELFLLQRVEHFVVINGDHGCRLVQAVKDCGNLGFAAKAAARTRTLRCAGSGGEFHG